MLKPRVQIHDENGLMVAEFWDCLRLDPAPVLDLRNKFETHLRTTGRPDLVVDLLGVGFAGSASLGNFVAMQRLARPRNGRVIFCNVDPTVFEVFRVSKLSPLFEFVADRPAAHVLAIQQPPALGTDGHATPPSTAPRPAPSSNGHGLVRSSRRRNPT
jgi:anti-anti-sigma factor